MSTRLATWQDNLAAYIAAHEPRVFDWAANSCLLFAGGAVTVMTGRDPWATERAQVAGCNRRQVLAWLKRYGGGLLGATDKAMKKAGLVSVAAAGEGDIVLADLPAGPAVGVCLGRVSVFVGFHGVERIAGPDIRHAWGVR